MSLFDGKLIGRIDLNPRRPVNTEQAGISAAEAAQILAQKADQDRIWRLVKGAAEGTNISTPEHA